MLIQNKPEAINTLINIYGI